MRILLDNCVPRRFGNLFEGHEVIHASRAGFAQLENGDLIRQAELEGYEAMITVDKNLMYQQNLASRQISIIVMTPRFVIYDNLAPLTPQVLEAIGNLTPGSFVVIEP